MLNICCFHCERCNKETHFVPIHRVRSLTGVSRSTVYYWMEREWVHWVELPSGRKLLCQESLHHWANEPQKPLPKGAAA